MTVQELIEKLQEFPPDAEVIWSDPDMGYEYPPEPQLVDGKVELN